MKRSPYLAVIALALLSAGCTTTRYVSTPCITPAQLEQLRAALPPKVGQSLTGDAQKDAKIIAASAVELRGYSEGLLEVLRGCVGSDRAA